MPAQREPAAGLEVAEGADVIRPREAQRRGVPTPFAAGHSPEPSGSIP
jgi:hypothetical protein